MCIILIFYIKFIFSVNHYVNVAVPVGTGTSKKCKNQGEKDDYKPIPEAIQKAMKIALSKAADISDIAPKRLELGEIIGNGMTKQAVESEYQLCKTNKKMYMFNTFLFIFENL